MRLLVDGQTLSTPDINRGIGTYLINILEKIVHLNPSMEVYLGVYDDYDKNSIKNFSNKLKTISYGKKIHTDNNNNNNNNSLHHYENSVFNIIREYDIDIFWIPNMLMLNVNFIKSKPPCNVVVTVYDLIPLVFKEKYINLWPNSVSKDYSDRISYLDKISDSIVSISESTKKDLVNLLGISSQKINTIYLGYKNIYTENVPDNYVQNELGITNYILYVGGFDPRKNMENSVLAFKKLITKYKHTDLYFIITCFYDESSFNRFQNLLKENNLLGRVILTGYVADNVLNSLYKNSKVFFFPSLYEGFGLPLLEAIAYGIPIAASNRSSIPEVVGNSGLLFDPENIEEMADKLDEILSNKRLSDTLSLNGKAIANKFSWEKSARELLSEFEQLYTHNIQDINSKQLKIAYFTPLSPQKTGISTYSEELLPHLAKYVNIDLFIEDGIIPSNEIIKNNFNYYSYKKFEYMYKNENYDAIIYHMGNNTIHKFIYDTLVKYPGITVLHDYVLHPFIQHITLFKGNSKSYIDEMRYAYGDEGERIAQNYAKGFYQPVDLIEYPLNERIIKSSKLVVVHNHYTRQLLCDFSNIKVISLGRNPSHITNEIIEMNKDILKLKDKWPIIGCFGFMNENKRIDVVLNVFRDIVSSYPKAILLLAGEMNKDFKNNMSNKINELNLKDNVIMTGYISQDLYEKYLSVTDVIVNLRYPTMGETSKTLLDAMAFGKPTIVSNIGSYKEIPDSCCWKVDVDIYEKELLSAYIFELIHTKELREKMVINAINYIKMYHMWEEVVKKYLKVVSSKI